MVETPYRTGRDAPTLVTFRVSWWARIKLVVLFLFCVAVAVFCIAAKREWNLTRVGLIIMFTLASAIMGFMLNRHRTTYITLDEIRITSHVGSVSNTLTWAGITRVKAMRFNDNVHYTLQGIDGTEVVVSNDLQRFDELKRTLNEHVQLPNV